MAITNFGNPLMLGFENLERIIDQVASGASENYPPYDIEQLDNTHTAITVAVAGFEEDELSITLENKQLIIKGRQIQTDQDKERKFIHKGISSRQFQKIFVLADGIEIIDANLAKGLLKITLERNEPEVKITKVKINNLDKNKAIAKKNDKR